VPVSSDGPIIDTPSNYRKMQARRNAALPVNMNNSQATIQPTPSGSPARLHHMTPEELASATFSLNRNGDPLGQDDDQNVDQDDSQNFLIPSSPPSQNNALERVPETPMADLPSSPPLPLLTSANLRQLNSQPAHQRLKGAGTGSQSSSSSHSRNHASPLAPPPSIRSIPSEVAHRISRLILRMQINAANHAASEEQLEATRGALEAALARVQHEASRVNIWMGTAVALSLPCLAYAAWCQYNSAEFALIEECRSEWFGL
jgi:hypothetical protein